jgi:hypothetical protein
LSTAQISRNFPRTIILPVTRVRMVVSGGELLGSSLRMEDLYIPIGVFFTPSYIWIMEIGAAFFAVLFAVFFAAMLRVSWAYGKWNMPLNSLVVPNQVMFRRHSKELKVALARKSSKNQIYCRFIHVAIQAPTWPESSLPHERRKDVRTLYR